MTAIATRARRAADRQLVQRRIRRARLIAVFRQRARAMQASAAHTANEARENRELSDWYVQTLGVDLYQVGRRAVYCQRAAHLRYEAARECVRYLDYLTAMEATR